MKKSLALIVISSTLMFSGNSRIEESFTPESPKQNLEIATATCVPDIPETECCLGEEPEIIANPSLYPDCQWSISAGLLYWSAHQDGMEFAIRNFVFVPVVNPLPEEIDELNNLVNDDFERPKSKWDLGYEIAVGYRGGCDGWDLNILWDHFCVNSAFEIDAEVEDNQTLVTLLSAFAPAQGGVTYARGIDTEWKVQLDLVDFELGRALWVGERLTFRPFVGVRYARIDQDYDLEHKGGSWSPRMNPTQDALSGLVHFDNFFHGAGLRSGLNTSWNLNCGFGFYGDLAASLLFGSFKVSHDEKTRMVANPFTKETVLDSEYKFRASRAIFDVGLGVQWLGHFCGDCYSLLAKLGWDMHFFAHQNQMWQIARIGNVSGQTLSGENTFTQSRGSLDAQGLTFSLLFGF